MHGNSVARFDLNINPVRWGRGGERRIAEIDYSEWTERIKRAEKSGERLRYKWMRLRTAAGKAERAQGRDCSRVFQGKKRCETVYSQLARIFFRIERRSVPPERVHYFSLRRCGSIMFVSFIQKALCGRTLVPWTLWCNALWLIVLRSTEKPLSPCTLFAECVSFRRCAISGAVNRKRKSNRRARFNFHILLRSPPLVP